MTRTFIEPEHERFQEPVRRFCEREATPHIRDREYDGITPRAFRRKAGNAGLPCTTIRVEYGGGCSLPHACVVTGEIVRAARCSASGGPLPPAIARTARATARYSTDRAVRGVGNILGMNRRGLHPGQPAVRSAAPFPAHGRGGEVHP